MICAIHGFMPLQYGALCVPEPLFFDSAARYPMAPFPPITDTTDCDPMAQCSGYIAHNLLDSISSINGIKGIDLRVHSPAIYCPWALIS